MTRRPSVIVDHQGTRKLRVLHQGAWALLGQGASSLGNLLVAVAVARVVSPVDFGVFSLVVALYHLALRAARSGVSTPLLMSVSGDHDDDTNLLRQITGSVGASLLVGVTLGLLLVLAGLVLGGQGGWLLGVLGFFLAPLLLQDAVRYAFIAKGQAGWSALCDGTWLGLQLLLSLAVGLVGTGTATAYTAAWAGTGAIAGFGGLLVLRVRPRLRRGREYLIEHRRLLPDLLTDNAAADLLTQLTPFAVATTAGLAAAGAVRAGLVLLGVVNIVILGLTPLLQLEASRLHRGDPGLDNRVFGVAALALGTLSVAYAVVLVLLPDKVGEALLGQTWSLTSALTLPLAIYLVAQSPYPAAQVSLRARLALRAAAKMRLFTAPWLLALPSIGAILASAQGAAWGFAAAGVITGCWCVRTVRRVDREQALREPTLGLASTSKTHPGEI